MKSKRMATVSQQSCVACGACVKECPKSAIAIENGCRAVVNTDICLGCGRCSAICPTNSIEIVDREVAANE